MMTARLLACPAWSRLLSTAHIRPLCSLILPSARWCHRLVPAPAWLHRLQGGQGRRLYGGAGPREARDRRSVTIYVIASAVFMIGATYAGVPLYRMLCQSTGYGGEVQKGHDSSKVESMQPIRERVVRIRFNADTASSMQWNFRPQQTEIKVMPGETALAFYRARNPTDVPVVGISTYNVVPFEAAQYFNKIQCFCFEEQRLNAREEVDLPVFFYIDPEFCDDPRMQDVDIITLSYTFFEAKEGMTLPRFDYMQPRHNL